MVLLAANTVNSRRINTDGIGVDLSLAYVYKRSRCVNLPLQLQYDNEYAVVNFAHLILHWSLFVQV